MDSSNHWGSSDQHNFAKLDKLLLDQSFQYKSKQSTRDQKYQDVFLYKTNLRRENHHLKRKLQQTKQQILNKALGIYLQEIHELSELNLVLRQKHRIIAEAKKPKLQPTIGTNSVLLTPRSRRSIVNIYEPENSQGCQTERQNTRLNENIHGRKSLNFRNNENIDPREIYGRKSLKLSDININRQSQLTQKKNSNRIMNIGNNLSIFSECNSRQSSLRGSIQSKNNNKKQQQDKPFKIFTQFVGLMLEQEKDRDKNLMHFLCEHSEDANNKLEKKNKEEIIQISQLEGQIAHTSNNIQKLQKMMHNYEHETKQMQINIQTVSVMTRDLGKLKQNFITMKQKCRNIHQLRKQVEQKNIKLEFLEQKYKKGKEDIFEAPQSIKILLKLFGVEEKQTLNNPLLAKKQIKNIVRGKLQKPTKRKVKVKEMLDNIRDGRKKFKQLLAVYETRIKKLEKKITVVKLQECQK